MASEANAERLEIIKDKQMQMHALSTSDINWLIEQAEHAEKLCKLYNEQGSALTSRSFENHKLRQALSEQSSTVHVIKRRNGKATIIGWNGERYVYQSESTARGGLSKRGKTH